MTDTTAQEPTMEEILASIRRIISEDDAPAETPQAAAVQPAAEPEPEVSPALMDTSPSFEEPAQVEDDVLELTDRYETPTYQNAAAESIGDLDVHTADEPEPFPTSFHAPEPVMDTRPASAPDYDSLVGDSASASAASAFAGLTAALRKPEPTETYTGGGPTIDELARSLLRPMLKDWLDQNLPAIVEAQVRKEVERIARTAG